MIQSGKALFCAVLAVSGALAIPTLPQQADIRDVVHEIRTTADASSLPVTVVNAGKISRAGISAIAANNRRLNAARERRDKPSHFKRSTITVDADTSITPTVIDGGSLSVEELASIQPLQPNATTVTTDKRDAPPVELAERAETGSPFVTSGWGNYDVAVYNFSMDGPFQSIQAIMSASNMMGLVLTDLNGNTGSIMGNIDQDPSSQNTLTFNANERVTAMNIQGGVGNDKWPTGFSITTDGGQQYDATPATGVAADPTYQPNGGTVTIGSGIIGRIRASNSSIGLLCAFEVDMIDDLSDISISKMDYFGFTDSVMAAGDGNTVIIGSEILDNTNSSIQQSMSLSTSSAVQKSQEITVASAFTVGTTIQVAAEVEIPTVAKVTSSVSTEWQLQETSSETDGTSTTITNAATYTLACPATKFCQASAFFMMYNIDVDFNCTFTATTTSGATYSWGQSGIYKGASSTTAQLTLEEYDVDPSA